MHEVNWQTKVVYEFHNLPEHLSRLGHQVFVVDYDDSFDATGLSDWGTLKTRIFPNAQRAYTDAKITLFRIHPRFENINTVPSCAQSNRIFPELGGQSHDPVHSFVYLLLKPGVDTDVFCPGERDVQLMDRWGIRPDDLIVLFMGTLFEFSGMDVVLEGFGRVVSEIPLARLLIVGGGPLLERLMERSREIDLGDRVVFTGFQPYEDMPRYIRLARLCINPFRVCPATCEIIPTKLLQYLGCGVPLLATPLPGTLDVLEGEKHGVIFSDLDDGFIEKIIGLLGDIPYLKILGERAHSHILKNHDWGFLTRELEAIIRNTVEEGLQQ